MGDDEETTHEQREQVIRALAEVMDAAGLSREDALSALLSEVVLRAVRMRVPPGQLIKRMSLMYAALPVTTPIPPLAVDTSRAADEAATRAAEVFAESADIAGAIMNTIAQNPIDRSYAMATIRVAGMLARATRCPRAAFLGMAAQFFDVAEVEFHRMSQGGGDA